MVLLVIHVNSVAVFYSFMFFKFWFACSVVWLACCLVYLPLFCCGLFVVVCWPCGDFRLLVLDVMCWLYRFEWLVLLVVCWHWG